MELRDKLNSLEGYQEIIDLNIQFIKERFEKIEKLKKAEKEGKRLFNKPNLEVFKLTESTIVNYYIDLLKAEYSKGFGKQELSDLYQEYLNFFILTGEAKSSKDFLYGENPTPYYSTDQYDILLFTFSLAILLNINDEDFKKLVKVRDLVQEVVVPSCNYPLK
ncbi:PoNe immunity protein domain-containing protein [Snodgrassella communis]|uniref:PoNe immunity protein domain-containing protein n=1 Tax=Snodgrassella communis TaxID=2946699 RepID=UPI001EF3EBEE|nr:PoNe immunity protein domain-containing protein [Snodgrassella communis]WMY92294.1 DUF1910 domain-containing protein [Snodgrassella communis]